MSVVAFLAPQGNPVQGPQHSIQTPVNHVNQAETVAALNQAGGATAVVVAAGAATVLVGRSRTKRKVLETARGSVTVRAFESELGVQPPVGFFDPLGLSADGDVATFTRRRETEIKHGRLCMLATMGYITPELVGKWPGMLSPSQTLQFSDVPNGLGALSKVPLAGWAQILIYCAMVEVSGIQNRLSDAPGDFGWKVLTSADAEERTKKLSAEIANGRLAMMAIMGMLFQDGLTGSAWGDWANYTDSPLRAFENELGIQPPVGFWDPLKFTEDGDVEDFRRRRETELKNGRVAMFATMGYITPEYFKFDGFLAPSAGLKFADVPNGLKALDVVPSEGWLQILALGGFYELCVNKAMDPSEPGNYGRGQLGFTGESIKDPEKRKRGLNAELANGRLAMMAIIGMFFQDGLTGSAWGDWELYTASPLRAFENELGVQAPVGFWDPLGLAANGDVASFKRRRESEIKHGRISMLAAMGYMTPEITGKWPGLLSPSTGLKFEDIPNGLAAISKVPGAGWFQIFAYCAYVESSGIGSRSDKGYDTPGEFGFKVITSSDPAALKNKLNAEIANGRLAMMAIIGMFFQDGLTGSAWGDWENYADSPLRAFENELGVQAPVGFFDPVGFTKDGDEFSFKRRRSVEIKHGRICMLATMGYITPEITGKFPGNLSPSENLKFADVPNGLAAISKVPFTGWVQMIAYAGFTEFKANYDADVQNTPGDMGWKPPLLATDDPETKTRRLNAELANGRLAMMAIIGMFFQDGLTGSAWGDWANYTDSPLRAFENELGVQAPVGFFDPVGFTKDGDEFSFKRRRSVEIKHGRICMLATMGYITPEITGKFPGNLSPSENLKFADVPNGLAAISKVPFTGWVQMIAYAGFTEFKANYDADVQNTPGDMGWKPPLLATDDPETKTRRLNAELANGRLSMMAIIGMFFQDGLTGSAWGDWANYTDSPLR